MRGWWTTLVFVIGLLCAMTAPARADSASATTRASVMPHGPLEETPLKARPAVAAVGKPGSQSAGAWDWARIPVALGAVILLILVLRWMGKGVAGLSAGKNVGRGVQVLSRSVISPRERMLVVRFGRRLLLVGSGGGEMTPLCQLDDPDEVAEVLAQLGNEKGAAGKSFRAMFSRADKAYESAEPPAEERETQAAGETPAGQELAGLMARIRRMQDQFQRG